MFYPKEYKPHPELRRFVKCYWTLKSPEITGEIKKKQLLPDSGIKISFNLADPVQFELKQSKKISVPSGCISGAITSNFWVLSKGQIDRFGLQFHPGGIYPFIDIPAWELTDKIYDIEDLWNNNGRALKENIINPDISIDERIKVLDTYLLKRINLNKKYDLSFESSINSVMNAKGNIEVSKLSKLIQLSNRQLERKFNEKTGLSPKLLCRIIRFRNVFEHIAGFSNENWVSTALACGYYDQSHFINDFKSFTGLSPSLFVKKIIKNNLFINWYPNIQAILEKNSSIEE